MRDDVWQEWDQDHRADVHKPEARSEKDKVHAAAATTVGVGLQAQGRCAQTRGYKEGQRMYLQQ